MDKEDGMISISMLIVLSLMAVFSLYIYRLSLIENDSLEILIVLVHFLLYKLINIVPILIEILK